MDSENHRKADGAMFGRLTGPHGLSQFALASLIKWGDHLSVDNPEIDAQHEAIFGLGAKAHELWRRRANAAELRPLVTRLQKVLAAHFQYEEDVLADAGYPKLEQHKAEHEMMLADLAVIRARLSGKSKGDGPEPAWAVLNYVLGVTIGHILSSDLDYCHFLARHGNRDEEELSHVTGDRAGAT